MSTTPAIDYDALAAQHGGSAHVDYDALAAQHGGEPQHDFSSLTTNPKGEGTYKIKTKDGQTVDVPYSNVPVFTQGLQGSTFASPDEQSRFEKDAAADPKRPTFWNALTNPVGSGGREQGIGGGALQVGGQAVKAMVQPVAHPIDTAVGLYNTVRHPIDTVKGIASQVKADYDQGGVPLAAENLTGQALGAYESGRMAAPIAKAAMNAVPPVVGRTLLLRKTPEAAYESAMKPGTTISQADRAEMVKTGLQNAIPVSRAGVEKLGDLINNLNDRIAGEIGKNPYRPIDPNAVATRTADTAQKFEQQVVAKPDLDAIEAQRQQFLNERDVHIDQQGNEHYLSMPAYRAQAMKTGTYRILAGKYGEQGSAAVEAQKALARGLKEEIATQFPEIGTLNAAESKLLDLQPVLEKAVNRISNHQIIGIGTPVTAAATTAVTGSTTLGKVAMVAKAVLDNPNVKSRLAIAVSKGGKIPYSQALSRVQSYATSLGSISSVGQENSSGDSPTPAVNQ